MKTYNKLVRDKIPEIIEKDNKKCEIKILNDEEYKKALSLKLVEEANEFLESNNIDELADVLEVIDAIKKAFNFNKKTIEEVKNKKACERGKFEKRISLIDVL
jgi:predicted house-cleaning noncanonical NTP pyrophosphatase (MazG superfamily)